MQLHNAADGHEYKMSAVFPVWSSSTSNVCDNPSSVDAHGQYKHWWPSQAYHCTFCTRVFRTAQALGGHMNIHRRERACANDMGTNIHIRRDSAADCSTTILSESARLPAPIVGQRSPLFGGSHRLLMNRTPPASTNSMAPSVSCMENRYASRRIASPPPASHYDVSTHLVSANYAPIPPDISYLTEQGARAGSNGGYGRLEVAKLKQEPGYVNNTISDPLSWLFSQLPPPGSVTTLQQQPQQRQCHSGCRGNILMQKNLAKPYHRALAVSKSSPGARRSECRPARLCVQKPQSRCRAVAGESSSGAAQGGGSAVEESLDLELRL